MSSILRPFDRFQYPGRIKWADFFDAQGVQYVFYSAANIAAIQDVRRTAVDLGRNVSVSSRNGIDEQAEQVEIFPQRGSHHFLQNELGSDESDDEYYSANESDDRDQDPRGKILSAAELEQTFVENAPDLSGIYALHYI